MVACSPLRLGRTYPLHLTIRGESSWSLRHWSPATHSTAHLFKGHSSNGFSCSLCDFLHSDSQRLSLVILIEHYPMVCVGLFLLSFKVLVLQETHKKSDP